VSIDWLDLEGLGEEVLYANSAFAVTFRVDHMGVSISERYHSASRPDSTLELDWDDWNRITAKVIEVVGDDDA
jgi:hypothetical protein